MRSLAAVLLAACATTEPDSVRVAGEGLARLKQGQAGDLWLQCEPSDAEVAVDGVPQGVCEDFSGHPKGLALGEGMHRIIVSKGGHWPYETWLQPSGARATLNVKLQKQGGT